MPRQPLTADVLLETSAALQKPKGPLPLPHHFIMRGDSCKPIELGQTGWAEYFTAVRRLAAHPTFLSAAFPALQGHEDGISWDWPTCRRWSEKIFKMIADGRLKNGWSDQIAIKDVQRDVCTEAVRVMHSRTLLSQQFDVHRPTTSASTQQQQAPQAIALPINTREDYNKEMAGKPCYPWNCA